MSKTGVLVARHGPMLANALFLPPGQPSSLFPLSSPLPLAPQSFPSSFSSLSSPRSFPLFLFFSFIPDLPISSLLLPCSSPLLHPPLIPLPFDISPLSFLSCSFSSLSLLPLPPPTCFVAASGLLQLSRCCYQGNAQSCMELLNQCVNISGPPCALLQVYLKPAFLECLISAAGLHELSLTASAVHLTTSKHVQILHLDRCTGKQSVWFPQELLCWSYCLTTGSGRGSVRCTTM